MRMMGMTDKLVAVWLTNFCLLCLCDIAWVYKRDDKLFIIVLRLILYLFWFITFPVYLLIHKKR